MTSGAHQKAGCHDKCTADATRGRPEIRATTDMVAPGELGPPNPIAEATGVFDAINHQTLAWLEQYAAGRSEPDGPFGSDVYLVSMQLYTQFVSYRLIHDLLAWERARLMPVAANASSR
ncbi:MAG: hypothetical protein ACE10B_02655 [Phycisphaerales bacterium]